MIGSSACGGFDTLGSEGDGHTQQGLFFIVGPCVIESEELVTEVARVVARIAHDTGAPFLFKSSYDKANRTSVESFRGPGIKDGLAILARVREATGLLLVSDIHAPEQAPMAAAVLDVLQIPAFLCRQTDLLVAAGSTGKCVNVKKGQFLSPDDMEHAIRKIASTGNSRIMLTERGSSFGYQDLVVDMRSIVRMKRFGLPVVFDATHSAQLPGRGSGCSGGDRSLVAPLARAATAAGADGIFMEVHPDPDRALCDGPNSLALRDLEPLVKNLLDIRKLLPDQYPRSSLNSGSTEIRVPEDTLQERLKKIRLIVLDVDGIMTDGRIIFGSDGLEIKSFDVRDGHGIKIAKRCGLHLAVVTGRMSDIVPRRAAELDISRVYQRIWDKRPVMEELLAELGLTAEEVAVLGDDVVDIPLFRRAGAGFTVPEAPAEVLSAAHYVTRHRGGRGAVREAIEMILKAQGKWDHALARYYE
jgi:2-dehydro-3-deoxyphosphooctonate aldolase (KDO 8-P synthase)